MKNSVVHAVEMIKPGGGPSGYVFNLHQALKQRDLLGTTVDTFFQGSSEERVTGFGEISAARKLHSYLPVVGPGLTMRLVTNRQIRLYWQKPLEAEVVEKLKAYHSVVFHSVRMATRYLRGVQKNGQQVYVMVHPPTNLAVEMVDGWQSRYGQTAYAEQAVRKMARLELQTYLASAGVLTMTRQGLHAYFDFDPAMRDEFFNRASFHEIPSGVPAMKPTKNRDEMRHAAGIPRNAFVVGFFGRYHNHKGFDLLIAAAKLAFERKLPVRFVTAGSGPIEPPADLPNLTNLGWRRDIADVANMVDLVTIPNRVAAFDLLALESMSIAKPILASGIGGNVFLASTAPGVKLFNPITAEAIVDQIERMNPAEAARLGELNLEAYNRLYNVQAFVNRHLELADKFLSN